MELKDKIRELINANKQMIEQGEKEITKAKRIKDNEEYSFYRGSNHAFKLITKILEEF